MADVSKQSVMEEVTNYYPVHLVTRLTHSSCIIMEYNSDINYIDMYVMYWPITRYKCVSTCTYVTYSSHKHMCTYACHVLLYNYRIDQAWDQEKIYEEVVNVVLSSIPDTVFSSLKYLIAETLKDCDTIGLCLLK